MGFELVDDYMKGIWYDSSHDDQGYKDDEHSWEDELNVLTGSGSIFILNLDLYLFTVWISKYPHPYKNIYSNFAEWCQYFNLHESFSE